VKNKSDSSLRWNDEHDNWNDEHDKTRKQSGRLVRNHKRQRFFSARLFSFLVIPAQAGIALRTSRAQR